MLYSRPSQYLHVSILLFTVNISHYWMVNLQQQQQIERTKTKRAHKHKAKSSCTIVKIPSDYRIANIKQKRIAASQESFARKTHQPRVSESERERNEKIVIVIVTKLLITQTTKKTRTFQPSESANYSAIFTIPSGCSRRRHICFCSQPLLIFSLSQRKYQFQVTRAENNNEILHQTHGTELGSETKEREKVQGTVNDSII